MKGIPGGHPVAVRTVQTGASFVLSRSPVLALTEIANAAGGGVVRVPDADLTDFIAALCQVRRDYLSQGDPAGSAP